MRSEKCRKLSVIVPCYNEEKAIRLFNGALMAQLRRIEPAKYEYEVIYVDDGSRDKSLDRILEFAGENSRIKYLSFSRNFGKEAAMLAGLEYADGDCAVIMDADLQHPPGLIHRMLEKYEEGYDQVIGKRDRRGESRKTAFFARTYYRMVNGMIDVKLVDGAGDFRLLSRKAIDAVLSLRETNRFSKGIFSWVGFNQVYLEYENRQRYADESRWSFKRLLRYGVDGIVSFNVQPLRSCVYLGGSLLALSMMYLVYLFVRILIYGIDVPGYFTTITLISVLGGVQLLSLGIIGEYVGRIYAEVKKRPAYIVSGSNMDRRPGGNPEKQEKQEKRDEACGASHG